MTSLGFYVDDRCKTAAPNGKPWLEVREFVRVYWPLLSTYRLLVSENTKEILRKLAAEIKLKHGVELEWNLDVSPNSRALTIKLTAANKEQVGRILFFLDPDKVAEQWEGLDMLRQAAAGHGQKLHINRGAGVWAETEWAARHGIQKKPEIGVDDAIVLVGRGLAMDRFAAKYLEKLLLFPFRIVPSGTRTAIAELAQAANAPADVIADVLNRTSEGGPEIASSFVVNHFGTMWREMPYKLCHVIACPCRYRNQPRETDMEEFLRVCADPLMRVNLMVNHETAEEFIQRPLECWNPRRIILQGSSGPGYN